MRLYDFLDSGNGYKARLLLHKLGLSYERVELDILTGETRTEAFLAKNPNGRVPALELDDGTVLPESNAIITYLAEGSRYLPEDRLQRAQCLQWMFFEQYNHEPSIAVARYILRHTPEDSPRRADLPTLAEKGNAALGVMERHLDGRGFFVGEQLSVADIALYAYSHVADQGGFDLSRYPNVQGWLDRVTADEPHIPITAS